MEEHNHSLKGQTGNFVLLGMYSILKRTTAPGLLQPGESSGCFLSGVASEHPIWQVDSPMSHVELALVIAFVLFL